MRLQALDLIRNHVLVIAALLAIAPMGHADQDAMPLGDLVAQADIIVIGQVDSVSHDHRSGDQLAIVLVEEQLKGRAAAELTLQGSTRDPSLPNFYRNVQILAFLHGDKDPGAAIVGDATSINDPSIVAGETILSGGSVVSESIATEMPVVTGNPTVGTPRRVSRAIGGIHGVLELAEGSEERVVTALTPLLDEPGSLGLADARATLSELQPALPPALVASVTRELSGNLSPNDASLLAEIACDPLREFLPQARLWAQYRVADLKISEARGCLESAARKITDPSLSLTATEALGDLGDPKSVPTLLSLLEPFSTRPDSKAGGDEDATTGSAASGPQSDPENENTHDTSDETLGDNTLEHPDDDPLRPSLATDEEASDTGGAPDPEQDGSSAASGLGILSAATLALGKIADPRAIPALWDLMYKEHDFGLQSTIVHSLGLIGSPESWKPLGEVVSRHPDPYIRDQARHTLLRMAESDPRACGPDDADRNGVGDFCDAIPAPEPGSSLMLLSGLFGLHALARHRRGPHVASSKSTENHRKRASRS